MKTSLIYLISVLTENVCFIVQAKIGFGLCEAPSVVQNFDWEPFAGFWYETYTDWGNLVEIPWKCTTEAYTKSDFNDNVGGVNQELGLGRRYSFSGMECYDSRIHSV